QVVAEVGRQPDVGAHVPAGGGRRREQLGRLQLDEGEHAGGDHHQQGDDRLRTLQPSDEASRPVPTRPRRLRGERRWAVRAWSGAPVARAVEDVGGGHTGPYVAPISPGVAVIIFITFIWPVSATAPWPR